MLVETMANDVGSVYHRRNSQRPYALSVELTIVTRGQNEAELTFSIVGLCKPSHGLWDSIKDIFLLKF